MLKPLYEYYPSKEGTENWELIVLSRKDYNARIRYLLSRIEFHKKNAECYKELYEYNNYTKD